MDFIVLPFGMLLRACYLLFNSYAFALLIFTIIFRLIMLPSSIKAQKTQAANLFINTKVAKLREKYANDKLKLNQEISDLYKQENANPLSGCLPMLLPLLLLWPVIGVIYKPMTYIARVSPENIKAASTYLTQLGIKFASNRQELDIIKNVGKLEQSGQFAAGFINDIKSLNLDFLGMKLTETPVFSWNLSTISALWLIPVVAAVTSLLFSLLSMQMSKAMGAPATANGMLLIMPVMSLFMCFSFPAGMGLYWIYSNIVGLVIQYFINRYYNPLLLNAKWELKRRQERINREAKIKELNV